MKRQLKFSKLLVSIIGFMFFAVSLEGMAQNSVEVYAEKVSGSPGETVNVPINADNCPVLPSGETPDGTNSVVSVELKINYDSNVLSIDVTTVETSEGTVNVPVVNLGPDTSNWVLGAGPALSSDTDNPGEIRVAIAANPPDANNANPLPNPNNQILKIPFTIKSDVQLDTYTDIIVSKINNKPLINEEIPAVAFNHEDPDLNPDDDIDTTNIGYVDFEGPKPFEWTETRTVCNFYGTAKIAGVNLEVGDWVGAFAPDVVTGEPQGCIGAYEVDKAGEYGLLAAYGDDTTTGDKDGAAGGDTITFMIWNADTDQYIKAKATGPDDNTWTQGQSKEVNLDTLSAPTNLKAFAGDGEVSLEWEAVTDATGYNVYRGTESGVYTLLADAGNNLTYVDTTVSNGTTYYYVVKAYEPEGPRSDEIEITSPFSFHETNRVANFYGDVIIYDNPAEVGDIVAVFAPDVEVHNGCIGTYIVDKPGEYGLLAAYGDDTTTPKKDGADDGDELTFKVFDKSEGKVFTATVTPPPTSPPVTWSQGTSTEVNLTHLQEFVLHLKENWNLISFPVAKCFYESNEPTASLPPGTEMVSINDDSDQNVDQSYDYMADWFSSILSINNSSYQGDGWRIVITALRGGASKAIDSTVPNRFHSMKFMGPGYGYWVKLEEGTGGGTITLTGARLAGDAPIELAKNWNLVGFLPDICFYDSDTPPAEDVLYVREAESSPSQKIQVNPPVTAHVLYSIEGDSRIVIGARPGGTSISADPTVPERFWSLHDICVGNGYWIKMNVDGTLRYPISGTTPAVAMAAPNSGAQSFNLKSNYEVKPTNRSMFVYGQVTLDGAPAPVGSEISVRTSSGVLCGKGEVARLGEFNLMPIYGDDFTTTQVDGARMGDELQIFVNESVAETLQPIKWLGARTVQNVNLTVRTIPEKTSLGQNFPNSFNPETWIPYNLSEPAKVEIKIYNLSGQLIRKIDIGQKKAGKYITRGRAAYWDGRNNVGERVSSGLYFYELTAGKFSQVKRMVVIK